MEYFPLIEHIQYLPLRPSKKKTCLASPPPVSDIKTCYKAFESPNVTLQESFVITRGPYLSKQENKRASSLLSHIILFAERQKIVLNIGVLEPFSNKK